MTLKDWLEGLGLEEYLEGLKAQGTDSPEDLRGVSKEELKEDFGIVKAVHRNKLFAAIEALDVEPVPTASPQQGLCTLLPSPVALPLAEYFDENHPVAKLWAACDTVEMLVRLLVIAEVGRQSAGEGLAEKLRGQLSEVIESPTLGAWFVMAQALAETEESTASAYIAGPLRAFLYGLDKPGTPETSFIRLRNRLAHGGGLTRIEATRLLSIWQQPFETTVLEAGEFLKEWELLGRNDSGNWRLLRGEGDEAPKEGLLPEEGEKDAVWLRRGEELIRLWPLAVYGFPQSGERSPGSAEAAQVYTRRETLRLAYTPLGSEGFGQTESGASAMTAFEALFRVDQSRKEKDFKINDFIKDLRKDAAQMVGREAETQQVLDALSSKEQGVWWLSGTAGMGKSFLMARLAAECMDHATEGTLMYAYRFRAGDQPRCSRSALAQFLVERLQAADALKDFYKDNPNDKGEKRLEALLGALRDDRHVLVLLDGLDEVARTDAAFGEEIPLALRFPRLRWLCAGRPEAGIPEAMMKLGAQSLFPEGLPPMSGDDIRGMLLEKIGPLRRKLLKQDREQGEEVLNPFVELVTKRAGGLPLYVKYVIGDVLSGKYRVLDGDEALPESLHAYHEELLRRLGIGDLQAVVTPVAATLACAYEPLSLEELEALLVYRKLLRGEGAGGLLERALAAIGSMIRTAPDPEGEIGYTLFHQSLRDHILQSEQMTHAVETAKGAFADIVIEDDVQACLENYLIRCGVGHLLDENRSELAKERLLDLEILNAMFEQDVPWTEIYRWWQVLGGEDVAMDYVKIIEQALAGLVEGSPMDSFAYLLLFACEAKWLRLEEQCLRLCLQAIEKSLGPNHEDTLSCVHNLGKVLLETGNFSGAEPLICRAIEGREKALGSDHLSTLSSLSNLGSLFESKGDNTSAEPLFRRALEGCEKSLGPNHEDTLDSVLILANHYISVGDYKNAKPLVHRATEGYEKKFGPNHRDTLNSLASMGNLLYREESYADARVLYNRVLDSYEAVLGSDHLETLRIVNNLGSLIHTMGDTAAAEPLLRRGMRGLINTAGLPATLVSMENLGKLLREKGDNQEAEKLYRQALKGYEKALGPDHMDTLSVASKLAQILEKKGDLPGAVAIHQYVLKERKKILGISDVNAQASLFMLAHCLQKMDSLEEAIQAYSQLLEAREQVLGHDHSRTLLIVELLAYCLEKSNAFSDAQTLYRRLVETRKRIFGQEHETTLRSISSLAGCLEKSNHYSESEILYREKLEIEVKTLGPEHEQPMQTLLFLTNVLESQGNLEEAEKLYRRALDAREKALGPDHADTLSTVFSLAVCLQKRGKTKEAGDLFVRELNGMEAAHGAEHDETFWSIDHLVKFHVDLGEIEKARVLVDKYTGYAPSINYWAALDCAAGNLAAAKKTLLEYLEDEPDAEALRESLGQNPAFKPLWDWLQGGSEQGEKKPVE